ncbi:hypothetical protein [Streptomyces sp. enrichment culture]|uniref:hypothetical protein n=1 Tax=Streptomyces sp. enrichment culture TaxID=1795815 RepID=UPI003F565C47
MLLVSSEPAVDLGSLLLPLLHASLPTFDAGLLPVVILADAPEVGFTVIVTALHMVNLGSQLGTPVAVVVHHHALMTITPKHSSPDDHPVVRESLSSVASFPVRHWFFLPSWLSCRLTRPVVVRSFVASLYGCLLACQ